MNKVLIFGDVMIDEYIYGNVSRISPEAPVPVLRVGYSSKKIGGAGNVADNVTALGAEAAGCFLMGKDSDAKSLETLLSDRHIDVRWCVKSKSASTIKKTRAIGNHQQVVRIDYNDSYYLDEEAEKEFLDKASEAVEWSDVIVISDYGKGTCSAKLCRYIISKAKSEGKTVIVDPKGTDWDKYRGASIITPNMKEINQFSGMDIPNDDVEIEKAYAGLPDALGIDYVLLTRSEKGMSLIGKDNGIFSIKAVQRKVFDVSGAGDTVVAALAVMLNRDMSNIKYAMNAANIAAGIVVAKPGTAVATKKELDEALGNSALPLENKIFRINDRRELLDLVNIWRRAEETVVTTNGCFDILHRGHISMLNNAGRLGDHLVVLLNSDASVKRLKGEERPINTEMDRAFLLAALKCVDAVAVFDPKGDAEILDDSEWDEIPAEARKAAEESPIGIIKLIQPDVHVKGGDYMASQVPEAVYAKSFTTIPFVDGYSTTNVIDISRGAREVLNHE
jgi:D-beta-D-heptose 7-phosphate kinase/D-beta-D-heptose 1-phosphate adenosyltransferase